MIYLPRVFLIKRDNAIDPRLKDTLLKNMVPRMIYTYIYYIQYIQPPETQGHSSGEGFVKQKRPCMYICVSLSGVEC